MDEGLKELLEFNEMLEEKRHRSMVDVLSKILAKLNSIDSKPVVEQKELDITQLVDAMQSSKGDDELVYSMKVLGNQILKKLEELKPKEQAGDLKPVPKKDIEFIINRAYNGLMTSVTVVEKDKK